MTPTVRHDFFVEEYFDSWYPKIHGPCNYLQSYFVADLIDKCVTTKNYPFEMFCNGTPKKTRSSIIDKMDNGIPSSSSDSATTPKKKKNCRATFKI